MVALRGLAHRRKARGLTQEDLSKIFNISSITISRWEMGAQDPGTDTLLRLAEFFSCTLEDLINPPTAPVKPGELREKKAG